MERVSMSREEIITQRRNSFLVACQNEVKRAEMVFNSMKHLDSGLHNYENHLKKLQAILKRKTQEYREGVDLDSPVVIEQYPELYYEALWAPGSATQLEACANLAKNLRLNQTIEEKNRTWLQIDAIATGFNLAFLIDRGPEPPVLIIGRRNEHSDLCFKALENFDDGNIFQTISGVAILNENNQVIQINNFERLAPEWTTRGHRSQEALLSVETYKLTPDDELCKIGDVKFQVVGGNFKSVIKAMGKIEGYE